MNKPENTQINAMTVAKSVIIENLIPRTHGINFIVATSGLHMKIAIDAMDALKKEGIVKITSMYDTGRVLNFELYELTLKYRTGKLRGYLD
jgi:hypothetical protein